MKFSIITFGCKVNQYESNMMKEKMLSSSFCYEKDISLADIIIVNTCTVTNTADSKCLKMIRKIKREHPNALLVVVGCSSQNKQELYKALGIDLLLGNKDKSKIALLINEVLSTKSPCVRFYNDRNLEFESMELCDYDHIRAFIKIEDGCDNFCSYCIIPYVRGSVRSKNYEEVLNEAKNLALSGHKEIVLTGIHTGRYASNQHDLSDLLHDLAAIEEIERIRLSSIEITELNDKFLEELRVNKKLCDHLHIPLQAGSDFVLKKMNRKYDTAYFEEKLTEIRSIRPQISITTDIIVGHPYETEAYFEETLLFSEKVNFAKIHVFPYSKREGTKAASMMEQVSEIDKKKRVKKLMELSSRQEKEYYDTFKGVNMDILIEEVIGAKSFGHTSNYLYVELDEVLEVGKIYSRKL